MGTNNIALLPNTESMFRILITQVASYRDIRRKARNK
jgi:hypothetical protein